MRTLIYAVIFGLSGIAGYVAWQNPGANAFIRKTLIASITAVSSLLEPLPAVASPGFASEPASTALAQPVAPQKQETEAEINKRRRQALARREATLRRPPTQITTLSGRTFYGVKIKNVEPDGIVITHSNGGGRVKYTDMTQEMQTAFGIDKQEAAAYASKREAANPVELSRVEQLALAPPATAPPTAPATPTTLATPASAATNQVVPTAQKTLSSDDKAKLYTIDYLKNEIKALKDQVIELREQIDKHNFLHEHRYTKRRRAHSSSQLSLAQEKEQQITALNVKITEKEALLAEAMKAAPTP